MKLFLISFAALFMFGFSHPTNNDNKRMENQINGLLKDPDLKSSEFIFLNDCYCKYTYEENSAGSGNYTFNYDFNLSEITDVTYKRSGNKFQLILSLDRPESNSISIDLNTSDEKLIKELSSSFLALSESCKAK